MVNNEETKICGKCGLNKSKSKFYKRESVKDGYRSECISCSADIGKKYREENREKIKQYQKERFQREKKYQLERKQKWRRENPEEYKAQNHRYYEKSKDIQFEKRKIKLQDPLEHEKYITYFRERKKIDPEYKLICNLRTRLNRYLKSLNGEKESSAKNILGCSPPEFRNHLEKQFKEGMTWENHGQFGWHIDHIIPLESANRNVEKLLKLFHYTNTQPLWWKENLDKRKFI